MAGITVVAGVVVLSFHWGQRQWCVRDIDRSGRQAQAVSSQQAAGYHHLNVIGNSSNIGKGRQVRCSVSVPCSAACGGSSGTVGRRAGAGAAVRARQVAVQRGYRSGSAAGARCGVSLAWSPDAAAWQGAGHHLRGRWHRRRCSVAPSIPCVGACSGVRCVCVLSFTPSQV